MDLDGGAVMSGSTTVCDTLDSSYLEIDGLCSAILWSYEIGLLFETRISDGIPWAHCEW